MISDYIAALVDYAVEKGLIDSRDKIYCTNRLIEVFGLENYKPDGSYKFKDLDSLLSAMLGYAEENGIIEAGRTVLRDLFDTKIMGCVTMMPSAVIDRFDSEFKKSPEAATNWYYDFSKATNYIRTTRIAKNQKWIAESEYGDIEITVNLSKPEKDPASIAAAKKAPKTDKYPSCALCKESEGFCGNLMADARQNHRIIPIEIGGKNWFFQYSPYSYYNEHCIVFSSLHEPMLVSRGTFERMTDFIEMFPHYFIGSNADLPIVGGSILTHDHMQGGRHTFAMENAPVVKEIKFDGFDDVEAAIIKWPLSVIRIKSENKKSIVDLSEKILAHWRKYTDEKAVIFANTDGEDHNTITPIARMHDGKFEMDLVLRNNLTTEEHPLGLYHPHEQYHNIKKENIGLIEVMGLAVLPARLKRELSSIAKILTEGGEILDDSPLKNHKNWVNSFKDNYTFTKDNALDILHKEVGKTFVKVLECAGVYKQTEEGIEGMLRFVDSVNR